MPTIKADMVTCRRCGGSGQHSWNSVDGNVCYGCSGRGTVRSAAAKKAVAALTAWKDERASVAVTDVKAGDVVRLGSFGRGDKFVTVERVEHRDDLYASSGVGETKRETNVRVTLHAGKYGNAFPIYPDVPAPTVRRPLTAAESAEYIEFARTLKGVTVIDEEEAA